LTRRNIRARIGGGPSAGYRDDRKPISQWFSSQARYASLEASHLLRGGMSNLGWVDRIRLLMVPAPILMFFYVLFIKRCLLDGWPGCTTRCSARVPKRCCRSG
jgi:hypothetical protein